MPDADTLLAYLSDRLLWLQFGAFILSALTGLAVASLLKHRLDRLITLHGGRRIWVFMRTWLQPLAAPLAASLLIVACIAGGPYYGYNTGLLGILLQVTLLWLVFASIRLFTESRSAKWSLVLIAIPLIGMDAVGLLDPFIELLKEISFSVGNVTISLYSIFSALLAVIVLLWIAQIALGTADISLRRFRGLRASNRDLLLKIVSIVIYSVIGLIGLNLLGVDLTALAVFGGALGVGIGFGLQKITSNFISGIILLFEKSVEVDDLIQLQDGTFGFVRQTGARHMVIETFDGREIMIPNEEFITNHVTNWTYSNLRARVDVTVGVSYDADIEKAQALILEAAREHEKCLTDPEPVCFLDSFGDNAVNFLLYFWVGNVVDGRLGPKNDVLFAIWRKFKQHGIGIPYPQRDLHLKTTIPVPVRIDRDDS